MTVAVFHPEAEAELRTSSRWYEERCRGLGTAFLREAERTVE